MPTSLVLSVENPDEILSTGLFGAGALMRLQTSATEAGTYVDVAGTGSTPTTTVLAATRSYTGYDPSGTVSSWYRTRYENLAATRLSDWSAAFQTGDETGGLICSVYDVEQELGATLSANDRENVLEKIRQVTVAIEGMTGRWFVPRPLSGTATYRVGSSYGGRLRIPKGIRSVTSLGIASSNQAATGGTYTVATSTGYSIGPSEMERDAGWPGTYIDFVTGLGFYGAAYGVEITGAFGWASVPYDIQGVAIRAVIRRYIGKSAGGATVAVGPSGEGFLLPDMSGADKDVLNYYRVRVVG